MELRIGCAQMDIALGNKKTNLETAVQMVKDAANRQVDVLVLPELFTTGYCLDKANVLAESPKDPDRFKFGFISCLTGHMSWLHPLWGPSAEQAVEEINAAGGIAGKPMEVIMEDHKSGDPKAGLSSMIKLVDMDKVPFVVVTFTPPNLACQPVAAAV